MENAPAREGSSTMRLKCPVCSTGTTRLKRYGVIEYVLFLGVTARWRRGSFTACPRCVRKKVLKDTFSPLHILLANLMWLLAVLPYNLGVMIASTLPGHSSSVVDMIEKKLGGRIGSERKEKLPLDAEARRQAAIEKVLALKRENAPRSRALDAAARAIAGVAPEPAEEAPKRRWAAPDEEIEWKVWHEDLFDRECPPNVAAGGRGLVGGLTEFWRRFLLESVRAGGGEGFSRFHLSWEGGSARVSGDRNGAPRLRAWVADNHVEPRDLSLLEQIAHAHAGLLHADRTGEEILAAAAASTDREEFEAQLSRLAAP